MLRNYPKPALLETVQYMKPKYPSKHSKESTQENYEVEHQSTARSVELRFVQAAMASTSAHRIAVERAEELFERRGIAEIREIEKATLKQIDEKKRKLREVVGESYDDVITSADAIVDMEKACQTIVQNVSQLRLGFTAEGLQLAAADATTVDESSAHGKSKLDELHAIGSRVKYLVDTPELIWSCLDSEDFLEASRRWLRSKVVHDSLQEKAPKGLLGRFPVLQHLWPNVEKLRGQVSEQIRQHLSKWGGMEASHSAACLAALASLEAFDSAACLTTFLNGRKSLIVGYLKKGGNDSNLISGLTSVIQNVVFQVGELFLGSRYPGLNIDDSQSCTLESAISEDDVGYNGQLFGHLEAKTDGEALFEERLWSAELEKLGKNLSLLNPEMAAKECTSWLAGVAEEVANQCAVLLGSCESLQELSLVEGTVNDVIAQWRPAESKPDVSVHEDSETKLWAETVDYSMGLKMDIWMDVFEKPFRQRALQLVEGAFHEIQQQVSSDLDSCLETIHQSPTKPLGGAGLMRWSSVGNAAQNLLLSSAEKSSRGRLDSKTKENIKSNAERISKGLDEKLVKTLEGVVALLDGSKDATNQEASEGGPGSRSSLSGLMSRPSTQKSPRRLDLEPQIQGICEAAAATLCDKLCSEVEHVSDHGVTTASIESALLIGTLCLEICDGCTVFPVFLGPPDNWRSHIASIHGSPMHTGRAPSSAFLTPRSARSRIEVVLDDTWALKDKFRMVGLKGYQVWATWAARGLADKLIGELEADALLRLKEAPQSWEKIKISMMDDAGVETDGMEFSLPSCPSGPMMKTLLESCQEVHRVGGPSANHEALQLFEWELGGYMCEAMKSLLEGNGLLAQGLREIGSLQLLLDVRLLREVLAGAQPLSALSSSPSRKSELERRPSSRAGTKGGGAGISSETAALFSAKKKLFSSLEAALSGKLDPIDWATYEPHLWNIVERFHHRSSVLFGALIQLKPAAPGGPVKMPQNAETNLMNLVPSVARFQYLPIRAPTHERRRTGSSIPQGVFDPIASTSLPVDPTGSYSFSDLGSRRASETSEEPAAPGSSTTFAGLQAKLGSMLGDKAAEVSALAQQQFGDLTSGVSTGWLSNLSFKGIGRTSDS